MNSSQTRVIMRKRAVDHYGFWLVEILPAVSIFIHNLGSHFLVLLFQYLPRSIQDSMENADAEIDLGFTKGNGKMTGERHVFTVNH